MALYALYMNIPKGKSLKSSGQTQRDVEVGEHSPISAAAAAAAAAAAEAASSFCPFAPVECFLVAKPEMSNLNWGIDPSHGDMGTLMLVGPGLT